MYQKQVSQFFFSLLSPEKKEQIMIMTKALKRIGTQKPPVNDSIDDETVEFVIEDQKKSTLKESK